MERNYLVGIVLVAAGLLLLLSNFGVLPANIWPLLLRFWPVLLICTGLMLVERNGKWGIYLSLALVIAVLAGIVYYSYATGSVGGGFTLPGRW